jgi:hypothetical protein
MCNTGAQTAAKAECRAKAHNARGAKQTVELDTTDGRASPHQRISDEANDGADAKCYDATVFFYGKVQ